MTANTYIIYKCDKGKNIFNCIFTSNTIDTVVKALNTDKIKYNYCTLEKMPAMYNVPNTIFKDLKSVKDEMFTFGYKEWLNKQA